MTTDAWKALKRERRRRICRRIRRAFLWTTGSVLAAFVIGYATWFRFGWMDLPLRCSDTDWGALRPVVGDLRPHAADSFEIVLKSLYGDAAVKRVSPERIRVRPVVVYFGDDRRLAEITAHLTVRFSDVRGDRMSPFDVAKDCRLVQHYLMAGGRAEACDVAWDSGFFQVIRQDSWPWLTRFFRVEQPNSSEIDGLLDKTLPPFVEGPHWLAKPTPLADLDCGPTTGLQIAFGIILILGEVLLIFNSIWPF